MPKIITQCTTTDLKQVVEVSLAKKEGDPTPKLNRKQRVALLVVAALTHAGLSFDEMYQIREIIFWDNRQWIWKFKHTPEAKALRDKLAKSETFNLIQERLTQIGSKLKDKEENG